MIIPHTHTFSTDRRACRLVPPVTPLRLALASLPACSRRGPLPPSTPSCRGMWTSPEEGSASSPSRCLLLRRLRERPTLPRGARFQPGRAVHIQVATPCDVDVRVPVPRQLLRVSNFSMALFHAALTTLTLALGNLDLTVPLYRSGALRDEQHFQPRRDLPHPRGGLPSLSPSRGSPPPSSQITRRGAPPQRDPPPEGVPGPALPVQDPLPLDRVRPQRAPIMMVLIAYALGVRDRSLLFAIGTLVATTMSFGWWVEVSARPTSQDEWCAPLWERLLPGRSGTSPS